MKRRRHNLGFTLLELVLVLVIIAACAAVAAPALRGFTHARRLPNTAQDLIVATRFCREQAIADGLSYRLYLDPQGGKWVIMKDDGTGTNTFTQVNSQIVPAEYDLPEGIVMDTSMLPRQPENARYINFDSGGHTEITTISLKSDESEVDLTCDAPLSSYHVVTAGGR